MSRPPNPRQLNDFLQNRQASNWPVKLVPLSSSHSGQLKQIGVTFDFIPVLSQQHWSKQAYEEALISVLTAKNCLSFAAVDSNKDFVVGIAQLKTIDILSKRAESYSRISPLYCSRNYNYHLQRELFAVAFKFLDLDYVYSLVSVDDPESMQLLSNVGFRYQKERDRLIKCNRNSEICFKYLSFSRQAYAREFGRRIRLAP